MTTSTRIHLFCDKQTSLQFCTILLILVMAKFDHNLRSDTFELRRKTETDCALDENEKDLLQHDVHVTCDPILIKCSRKTRRKNTILCYAQLSKSRQGKKNSTVFVSKLGVDQGSSPLGKILSGGGSVHRLSWQLRKIKPRSSENFAFVVSLIFLFKPKRSYGNTDS